MASALEVSGVIQAEQRMGEVIAKRYELRDVIASTSQSIIHRALDCVEGVPVAIKEFYEPDSDARNRVNLEIATHLALTGKPHIAPLHDNEVHTMPGDNQRAIVLKLAGGGSLGMIMSHTAESTGTMEMAAFATQQAANPRTTKVDVDVVTEMALDMVTAVESVHAAGLIHGDIKPGNILFDHQEGAWWLADFGIVQIMDGEVSSELRSAIQSLGATALAKSYNPSETIAGTFGFIAPERGFAGAEAQPPNDIYGLGVTMYQATTGSLPYDEISDLREYFLLVQGNPPDAIRTFRPEVPVVFEAVVMSCLEPQPKNRPTLADLRTELMSI